MTHDEFCSVLSQAAADKIEELRRERNAAQDEIIGWRNEVKRLREILDHHQIDYSEHP